MKHKRNFTGIIMLLMILVLMILLAFVFLLVWNNYYRKVVQHPFYQKGALLLTLVYIIIYFLFSRIYEGSKIGFLKQSEIIYSQSLAVVFTNIITYMQISLLAKKMVNPIILIIMTLVEVAIITIWTISCNSLYFSIYPPINMVMIYSNESAESLIHKISGHKEKYRICSIINIDKGLDAVIQEIDEYEAVIICDLDSSVRNKIVKYCYKKSIRIYMTPKISDIIIQSSDKLHIFDTPLLLCKSQGFTLTQRLAKRIMDIIISTIAIILLAPIMLITAAIIKLYDGGPAIYKQSRLTLNNKTFEILKFRSMVVNAESKGEARLASRNDDRITPIGKIIRLLRIDELPQLFNIIKGDMSIVGPRPERPEIAEKYMEVMPEFEFRTKVKAGLTGYAQIMGKYNTTPYDKIKLDLLYIGNYSVFMDIKLILMTIKILFMPESTEGVDKGSILPELACDKDK